MINFDEVLMLAYALEYDCNKEIQDKIVKILEKVENEMSIDTYIGGRLAEHGRVMGWSKESSK
jgi:hypothetical protein